MKLHTTSFGSGPDWVMLHGWGLNSQIWGDTAKELAKVARVTMIDLPGHGGSPMLPGRYALSDVVDAVLAVAPPLAAWLGWSLGGLIAQAIAEAHPKRVSKLILVTSNPSIAQRDDWPHGMSRDLLRQFALNLAHDYDQTLQRFLMLQCKGSEHARETARELRLRLEAGGRPRVEALQAALTILEDTDLRPHLADIACETLLIYGQHDTLVPASGAAPVAAMLPRARAEIIPGAAHAPFVSHPRPFLDLVFPFVQTS